MRRLFRWKPGSAIPRTGLQISYRLPTHGSAGSAPPAGQPRRRESAVESTCFEAFVRHCRPTGLLGKLNCRLRRLECVSPR